jgi:hypothetical protein
VNLLRGAAMGRQLWVAVATERALNSVLRLVVLGGLAITGHLTVTAAVLVMSTAAIVAGVAYWRLLVPAPAGPAEIGELVARPCWPSERASGSVPSPAW